MWVQLSLARSERVGDSDASQRGLKQHFAALSDSVMTECRPQPVRIGDMDSLRDANIPPMQAAGGAALGGGDYLMSFLGVVILSFGFRIFGQRRLMVHHAPEIFGSTTLSAAFSLFGTAAFARALGLAPGTHLPTNGHHMCFRFLKPSQAVLLFMKVCSVSSCAASRLWSAGLLRRTAQETKKSRQLKSGLSCLQTSPEHWHRGA